MLGQIISLCLKERSQHSDESGKHTHVWRTQSKTHFLKQQHSRMMQTDRMMTAKTATSAGTRTGASFTPEVEGEKKNHLFRSVSEKTTGRNHSSPYVTEVVTIDYRLAHLADQRTEASS